MLRTFNTYVGKPYIQEPSNKALVFPTSIILTCGEDVTVQSLVNISVISFACNVHNGSHPLTWKVYKDGQLTQHNGPFSIQNPTDSDYGTYTFVLSSTHCGSAIKVTTLFLQGQFLNLLLTEFLCMHIPIVHTRV